MDFLPPDNSVLQAVRLPRWIVRVQRVQRGRATRRANAKQPTSCIRKRWQGLIKGSV